MKMFFNVSKIRFELLGKNQDATITPPAGFYYIIGVDVQADRTYLNSVSLAKGSWKILELHPLDREDTFND